jgi:hypothetical protein
MLYLYHGTTSVCPVKVRVALDDKSLTYDGEILDLRRGDQHRQHGIRTGNRPCQVVALHCPIMRIPIDQGAVAPVERFAVEF